MTIAHQLRTEAAPQLAKLGAERQAAGDTHNAREMFLGALSADFDHVGAWLGLGSLAAGPSRYATAIAICRRALAMAPDDFRLKLNLGNVLWRSQAYAEAEKWLAEAYAAAPDEAATNQNIGLLYYATGRGALAETHFAKALDAAPTLGLRGDYAHGVLMAGDLARGLALLECRWDGLLPKNAIWDCGLPQWWGERKEGSTILLHHEQGYGDTLQFVRFVPVIKAASGASTVIFACPAPLRGLLDGQCGIDEVISDTEPGPIVAAARRADWHAPIMSATAVLKPRYVNGHVVVGDESRVIWPFPYINPPQPHGFMPRLGGAALSVGVCWGASDVPTRGAEKSIPLDEIVALGAVPGVRLWSLQFGRHAEALQTTAADHLISQIPSGLGDFAETASIMTKLDVVISADTSAAHLAAALGKTTFMLNPINPCWRWVHGAAPWYGSMTIFDQREAGNWRKPIADIATRLADMVEENRMEIAA